MEWKIRINCLEAACGFFSTQSRKIETSIEFLATNANDPVIIIDTKLITVIITLFAFVTSQNMTSLHKMSLCFAIDVLLRTPLRNRRLKT